MNGKEHTQRDNRAQNNCDLNEWRLTGHLAFSQSFTFVRDLKRLLY